MKNEVLIRPIKRSGGDPMEERWREGGFRFLLEINSPGGAQLHAWPNKTYRQAVEGAVLQAVAEDVGVHRLVDFQKAEIISREKARELNRAGVPAVRRVGRAGGW